jgi:hypothetical protein
MMNLTEARELLLERANKDITSCSMHNRRQQKFNAVQRVLTNRTFLAEQLGMDFSDLVWDVVNSIEAVERLHRA